MFIIYIGAMASIAMSNNQRVYLFICFIYFYIMYTLCTCMLYKDSFFNGTILYTWRFIGDIHMGDSMG